jgi:hypothetical protein
LAGRQAMIENRDDWNLTVCGSISLRNQVIENDGPEVPCFRRKELSFRRMLYSFVDDCACRLVPKGAL